MNKKILSAAFVAVMMVVSCGKESPVTNGSQSENQTAVPSGELVPYTFTADAAQTKTTLGNDGIVTWNETDAIKVYYNGGSSESTAIEIAENGLSATFTVLLPENMDAGEKLYAVYPAEAEASLSGSTLSISVPAEQTGVFKDVNIVAAAATAGNRTFAFRQVLSFINFTVSEDNPKGITRALFKDLYGTAITGILPVTFDENGNATTEEPTATGTEISLTDAKAGKNYMAILPDTDLESVGLKLGTSTAWLTPIASDTDDHVAMAHIKPLGTVDGAVSDAYYVKAGAEGNGTSWENAGGASLISTLTNTGNDYAKLAAAFKLDGYTIKVAEGTYEVSLSCNFGQHDGETKADFTIEGGYDEEGNADENAKATFSGKGANRIIGISDGVGLTLKNLILTNGKITSGEGAAVRASTSDLTIENCVFTKNVSEADGGALYFNSWSAPEYSLSITNSVFGGDTAEDGNKAKAGSAMWIVNANSADISGCTFMNNNATTLHDPYFGCVTITGNAEASLSECQFKNNTGGAIDVSSTSTSGLVTINKCRFEGNKTSYRGASVWVPGTLPVYLNNCVFKNDKGARRGISVAMDSATSGKSGQLGINNCTFDHGSTNTDGGNGTYDTEVGWIGDVWLSGQAIVANTTIAGEGVHGALNFYKGYGNPDGSVVVNSIICADDMKDYVWRLTGSGYTVEGYYNLFAGDYAHLVNFHDDTNVKDWPWEDNWSPATDPVTGLIDYTVPEGVTINKIPTVDEVSTAIKSQKTFGTAFYNWLVSVDGIEKDAAGNSRLSGNRQGALVK